VGTLRKLMLAPAYRWVCKKCASENEARVARCAACACPAIVAPDELEPLPPRKPAHFIEDASSGWLFFPESLIAGVLVLASPIWGARLLWQGQVLLGVFLLIGVCGAGYAAFRSFRANERWTAYASIVGINIIGAVVFWAT
jgi:hypothetical protein